MYLCTLITVEWLGVAVQPDVRGEIVDKSWALSQLSARDLVSFSDCLDAQQTSFAIHILMRVWLVKLDETIIGVTAELQIEHARH